MRSKPRLLVLAPEALFESFFDRARERRLGRSFRWSRESGRSLTARVRTALTDADAVLTTWDSPRFGAELTRLAPKLRVVGHCGGEVKGRFAAPLFERLT